MCLFSSGAWRELKKIKPLWTEPQGGSAEDLEKSIQEYYEAIKEGMGGIFFAVCRGKVCCKCCLHQTLWTCTQLCSLSFWFFVGK